MNSKRQLGVVVSLVASVTSISTVNAADNCTGYDILVTTHFEERDVGAGMKLQTVVQESILTSSDSIYNLVNGQCAGAFLFSPDGKFRGMGYCVRRDKDGDTQSIDWHIPPGAEKGTWSLTGGTGKFAGRTGSGWAEEVRSDGKTSVLKWGGSCK